MGPKMSNIHDGDEKIPTPSTLGRIRVKKKPESREGAKRMIDVKKLLNFAYLKQTV